MAVGLGSVDMPVPSVAEWEWLNWRFPRPVHAGDTIYARWTLTQKRPPAGGAVTSIVVWRIDVHTADGTMVAEGEIGAKVKLGGAAARPQSEAAPAATTSRRRRGRRSRTNGTAPTLEPTPVAAAVAAPASKQERTAGTSRRRRRRGGRSSGSAAREDGHNGGASNGPPAEPPPPAEAPAASTGSRKTSQRGIGGVLRRLRGDGR